MKTLLTLLSVMLLCGTVNGQILTLFVAEDQADTHSVATFAELKAAVASADPYDYILITADSIYFPPDSTTPDSPTYGTAIEITTNYLTIMGGSYADRPYLWNDSSGGYFTMFQTNNVTTYYKNLHIDMLNYDPDDDGHATRNRIGIMVGEWEFVRTNSKAYIDSCEIEGTTIGAVNIRSGGWAEVENSSIHNNELNGLGYGVAVDYGSYAKVHHCVFDSNRHSIKSAGWNDGTYADSYDVYNNTFNSGLHTGSQIDVHGYWENSSIDENDAGYWLAGDEFNIYNNTFNDSTHVSIAIRGRPETGAYIYDNTFNTLWGWYSNNQNITSTGRTGVSDQRAIAQLNYSYSDYQNDSLLYMGNIFVGDNTYNYDRNMPYYESNFSKTFTIQFAGTGNWNRMCAVSDSLTSSADSSVIASELLFGDFNGDGATDIVSKYMVSDSLHLTAGSSVWYPGVMQDSTGHLFISVNATTQWIKLNDSNYAIADLDVADVDGDGASDLIYDESTYSSGGYDVWTALPNAFNTYTLYTTRDFNGDGTDDNYRIGNYKTSDSADVVLYASDYSAGIDNWSVSATAGVLTGNIDGVSDGVTTYHDCLRFYAASDIGTQKQFYKVLNHSADSLYVIKGKYYIPATNTSLDGFALSQGFTNGFGGTSSYKSSDAWTTVGEWSDFSLYYYATATSYIIWLTYDGSSSTYTGAEVDTDDLIYLKNVRCVKVNGGID